MRWSLCWAWGLHRWMRDMIPVLMELMEGKGFQSDTKLGCLEITSSLGSRWGKAQGWRWAGSGGVQCGLLIQGLKEGFGPQRGCVVLKTRELREVCGLNQRHLATYLAKPARSNCGSPFLFPFFLLKILPWDTWLKGLVGSAIYNRNIIMSGDAFKKWMMFF